VPTFDGRSPTSALGPGGFVAYEHLFAVPAAVDFHRKLGRTRVTSRITELSTRVRDGLAAMRGVTLRTPRDPALSAGLTCFDVDGVAGNQVVEHLAKKRIQITTASYRIPYARMGTSILNTPEQVDKALRGIAELTR
jgi:selenocysteine lyase/cysteine desulfurase